MQVSISGKQINIGSSLQQRVKDSLEPAIKKYFEHPVSADVVFSKEGNFYRTNIIVNEGITNLAVTKANYLDDDIYSSFNMTLNKIEKQLRRYKSKIKNHRKRKASTMDFEENILKGKKYVLSPNNSYIEEHDETEDDSPIIIAEQLTNIEHLSVSEAVMKMDLAHLPALLFVNIASGRINVVYHRADGNISWVDPDNMK